jgi:hypothetical protein
VQTAGAAALALSMATSAVFAGEITGNGTLKDVNGRSFCAFSGQEDLQFAPGGSKGVPGHAQNWGAGFLPSIYQGTWLRPTGGKMITSNCAFRLLSLATSCVLI